MQILANALPGFRDLRPPLVAGYLWLVFAWILVDPNIGDRPSNALGGAVFDLGKHVGHVAIALAVSLVAYLIGSASQALTTNLGEIPEVRPTIVLNPGLSEIEDLRDRTRSRFEERAHEITRRHSLPDGYVVESVEHALDKSRLDERAEQAAGEASRELALPATLLVGKEPELFAEVDKLRAEGELRIAVVPPLFALLVAAVVLQSWWWVLGVPFVVLLLLDGQRRETDSRVVIADAIQRGLIKSSAAERFATWADGLSVDELLDLPARDSAE